MSTRILIENAIILSMDQTVGDLASGSILIDGDRIEDIAPSIEAADAEVIDASGMVVIPGFVDAHRHVWQSVLTMAAADADLDTYFAEIPGKLAPAFTASNAYTANYLGAIQALAAGITTVFDWSHIQHTPDHTDAMIDALRATGLRTVFGYGFPNTEPAWSMDSERPVPEDIKRTRINNLCSDDALVTMGMSVRGPEQSTMQVTEHDIRVGRELGLRISMHAGNGAFGVRYKSIERMHDAALMGPDIQYVHCTSLSDESIARIADSGGAFVTTPAVELQMQFGYPATTRFLACDIRPGLGADVVTSTDHGLFAQMSAAFQAARLQTLEHGTPSVTTRDILSFATIDGAFSIGLGNRIGSLTPGKKADVTLVKCPPLVAMNDPVSFIVLGANNELVDSVIVDGVVRKRNGKLVDVDEALARDMRACLGELIERSGYRPPSERYLK